MAAVDLFLCLARHSSRRRYTHSNMENVNKNASEVSMFQLPYFIITLELIGGGVFLHPIASQPRSGLVINNPLFTAPTFVSIPPTDHVYMALYWNRNPGQLDSEFLFGCSRADGF